MGKLVDDAKALVDAASNLVAEAETEESGTVTDKTVTKVTVCYSDGSSVDFSPAGDNAPAAPVVTPVTETPSPTAEDSSVGGGAEVTETPSEAPKQVAEGASEVTPTVAGVVPE